MFCAKCGKENTDTSKFCRKCGAPLRQTKAAAPTTPEPQSTVAAIPGAQAKPQPVDRATIIPQPTTPSEAKPQPQPATTLQPNIASLFCYVLGWVSGVVFLIIEKENRFVRFHAWQSIITFAILSIVIIILNSLTIAGGVLILLQILYWIIFSLTAFLWLFLMLKAYQGQTYKLPVVGKIAETLSNK